MQPTENKIVINKNNDQSVGPVCSLPSIDFIKFSGKTVEPIDVIIPAHNEERYLEQTMRAIRKSFEAVGRPCRIIVGLDSCTDNSWVIAHQLADDVVSLSFHSKWKTINYLTNLAQSEWIAFVDVGALWPIDMIRSFGEHEKKSHLVFIAPSYHQEGSSVMQDLNWKLESIFKSIENRFGGPISVHGSTVFYRLATLRKTLSFLSYRNWLNDDVIIPLTMRAMNPDGSGLYLPKILIRDLPPCRTKSNRRLRITMGNFEVINFIDQRVLKVPKTVLLLWYRRKIRIFWAYFLTAVIISFFSLIPIKPLYSYLFIMISLLLCLRKKVFRVSLLALFVRIKTKPVGLNNEFANSVKWH